MLEIPRVPTRSIFAQAINTGGTEVFVCASPDGVEFNASPPTPWNANAALSTLPLMVDVPFVPAFMVAALSVAERATGTSASTLSKPYT